MKRYASWFGVKCVEDDRETFLVVDRDGDEMEKNQSDGAG